MVKCILRKYGYPPDKQEQAPLLCGEWHGCGRADQGEGWKECWKGTMTEYKPIRPRNFSLAFEQMCSMFAIAQTTSAKETLRQLILHCFVILPNDQFENEAQLVDALDVLFGLQIPEHEVTDGIDILTKDGSICRRPDGTWALFRNKRDQLQASINEAQFLEDNVRQDWLKVVSTSYPSLDTDQAWRALRGYLAQAFRRHGVQTAALLDPSVDIAPAHIESLSSLLDAALTEACVEERADARDAISEFFVTVGRYPDRARYIAQLADGAFSYFSLAVAPDTADQLRRRLVPLVLFLDTNFLFGILGLDAGPQVAVSQDLLSAIAKHKLPFQPQYHQATARELQASIRYNSDRLKSRVWSRSLSRGASTSRYLSGVELTYHRRNAETGIDVESFFMPYEHPDVLLKDRGIEIYRSVGNRLAERASLLDEYREFLQHRGRDKPYSLIDHDTTVLDAVRQLRTDARSSLEASALLMTCDYLLYQFDWEHSQRTGERACTVLPSLFWQVLRPFISSDPEFDRSFAEAFALPEFRVVGSGAAEASSKMLAILAAYSGLHEETAARMLSNDLLIDQLRATKDDAVFQQFVEAAIVEQNAQLLEEKAALAAQLEQEGTRRREAERQLAQGQVEREREIAEGKSAQRQTEEKNDHELAKLQMALEYAEAEATKERRSREDAEQRTAEAQRVAKKARAVFQRVIAVGLGLLSIVLFEYVVYLVPWRWLVSHPNGYGLQAAFDAILALIVWSIFNKEHRKWCLGVGGLAFVVVAIQILGGSPLK